MPFSKGKFKKALSGFASSIGGLFRRVGEWLLPEYDRPETRTEKVLPKASTPPASPVEDPKKETPQGELRESNDAFASDVSTVVYSSVIIDDSHAVTFYDDEDSVFDASQLEEEAKPEETSLVEKPASPDQVDPLSAEIAAEEEAEADEDSEELVFSTEEDEEESNVQLDLPEEDEEESLREESAVQEPTEDEAEAEEEDDFSEPEEPLAIDPAEEQELIDLPADEAVKHADASTLGGDEVEISQDEEDVEIIDIDDTADDVIVDIIEEEVVDEDEIPSEEEIVEPEDARTPEELIEEAVEEIEADEAAEQEIGPDFDEEPKAEEQLEAIEEAEASEPEIVAELDEVPVEEEETIEPAVETPDEVVLESEPEEKAESAESTVAEADEVEEAIPVASVEAPVDEVEEELEEAPVPEETPEEPVVATPVATEPKAAPQIQYTEVDIVAPAAAFFAAMPWTTKERDELRVTTQAAEQAAAVVEEAPTEDAPSAEATPATQKASGAKKKRKSKLPELAKEYFSVIPWSGGESLVSDEEEDDEDDTLLHIHVDPATDDSQKGVDWVKGPNPMQAGLHSAIRTSEAMAAQEAANEKGELVGAGAPGAQKASEFFSAIPWTR